MTSRPPRHLDDKTPITVRRSSLNIGMGPVYAALARELAIELYERRLTSFLYATRLGDLARECDAIAETFDAWAQFVPPPSPDRITSDVAAWQDIKARARALGSEVQ